MKDYNKEFKDYIETLPPELKQAIYSIDYPEKLQQIVKNNKLMIDQAGKLEAETTLVMAGVEPLDNYVKNLVVNLGLSNIQASSVAHDVNELIFKNIRESLKKINEQTKEDEKIIEQGIVETSPKTANPTPTKEDLLAGIENPEKIKRNEESISFSSLGSNNAIPEAHETIDKDVEIKIENLPEIAPKAILPIVLPSVPKPPQQLNQNIAPIQNIVESKLTVPVIVQKQNIIIEEKSKLPTEKPRISNVPKPGGDPYRESII